MKRASEFTSIMLFRGPCDMRKQAYSLAEVVESQLKEAPAAGGLFLFCNRRRDIIKALYFNRAGFCLWTKKLDQNRFPWLGGSSGQGLVVSAEDIELGDAPSIFSRPSPPRALSPVWC